MVFSLVRFRLVVMTKSEYLIVTETEKGTQLTKIAPDPVLSGAYM